MNVAAYAKTGMAVIGSALTAAISYYPHASWIPIATAVVTVIGVYAVPNATTKSGDGPVLPSADITALVQAVSTIVRHIDAPASALAGTSTSLPPPAVVGTDPRLAAAPDPNWEGTQNVADGIAAETAFRSFADRVGAAA